MTYVFTNGIRFTLSRRDAEYVSQQGDCSAYARELAETPCVRNRLQKLTVQMMQDALSSDGVSPSHPFVDLTTYFLWYVGCSLRDEAKFLDKAKAWIRSLPRE